MDNEIIKQAKGLYIFAKDRDGRFTYCNENLAELLQLESPKQIIGKSDRHLPWKDKAEFYQITDKKIVEKGLIYLNILEKQRINCHCTLDILISKNKLLDNKDNCVGIIGSYVVTNKYHLIEKMGTWNKNQTRFYLGNEYGNEHLTKREVDILRYLLLGFTLKKIALSLNLSPRTIEGYLNTIKQKFQCKTKGDLITFSIKSGLSYLAFIEK